MKFRLFSCAIALASAMAAGAQTNVMDINTKKVGQIKILASENYKGGVG